VPGKTARARQRARAVFRQKVVAEREGGVDQGEMDARGDEKGAAGGRGQRLDLLAACSAAHQQQATLAVED